METNYETTEALDARRAGRVDSGAHRDSAVRTDRHRPHSGYVVLSPAVTLILVTMLMLIPLLITFAPAPSQVI
ncbi:hypothetical protein [Nocardioides nematodiphilus]|uniref:hypothetical protein n=1 Tax=Nocardioides nematodiphilus TaxID=2849669 RepID=UPI001CD918FF|nr:hypothetical protein [Nocardioides nematodiphilus]MCA1984804.1 hypothetical protein [Nocardioides nematodiphilus]